jgi:predicted O-linked N-acetylglucosamine transferase (SPINDLY family)
LGELVCANVEEYIELALALIEDDARRNALRDRLLVTDLEAAFFGEHPGGDVFGAAFSRMFDEHTFHGETIQ